MNIFITGGTTGIGAALAKLYLDEGHNVGVCGRSKEKFEETFVHVENREQRLIFYPVDVTDKTKIQATLLEFVNRFKTLDIIIANAGVGIGDKSSVPAFEKAYEVININVLGLMYTLETAIEVFKKQNYGHIVTLGSVAGYRGLPGAAAYCGSKAFVLKLSETLAIDLLPLNIYVTAIAPGFVDTPLTKVNKHPMPFLMESSKAALLIANAIRKRKSFLAFPFRMRLLLAPFLLLPTTSYVKLFQLKHSSLLKKFMDKMNF